MSARDPRTISPVDAYIAGFPPGTRKALRSLRALIRKAAPKATEEISYGIPAFRLHNTNFIYFAGWTKHIGVYPVTGSVDEAFGEDLAPYKKGKATARFPLDEALPSDLIRRIVRFMVKETDARAGGKLKGESRTHAKPKTRRSGMSQ
jgi:uncharacterized protein YdhG (YjbR/CyaY superfamily)